MVWCLRASEKPPLRLGESYHGFHPHRELAVAARWSLGVGLCVVAFRLGLSSGSRSSAGSPSEAGAIGVLGSSSSCIFTPKKKPPEGGLLFGGWLALRG